jgi:hypothetical protein
MIKAWAFVITEITDRQYDQTLSQKEKVKNQKMQIATRFIFYFSLLTFDF